MGRLAAPLVRYAAQWNGVGIFCTDTIKTVDTNRIWDSSEIAKSDPERGGLLLRAPSASALRTLLVQALK